MQRYQLFILAIFICMRVDIQGQNVGINTTSPQRTLEVQGADDQFIRIQTTNSPESGLELVNGNFGNNSRDWKMINNIGVFSFVSGNDNFATAGETMFRINASGDVGLNGVTSYSRLHVQNGNEASNILNGYFMLGTPSGINVVADVNEINVRQNGSAQSLYLQEMGGHTFIGLDGGNTYFGASAAGGNVGIGMNTAPQKLSIESNSNFHMYLRNTVGGLNDWYIGASNSSWVTGDNLLLFSPGSSSDESVFRLMDVSDNNGTDAPVKIRNSASQELLIDGNEIDSRHGPLHINYNSGENTLFNPSGGSVGVGTSNPFSTFHIVTPASEYAIRLQVEDVVWNMHPFPVSNRLAFSKNNTDKAEINGASGQWVALSDKKLKKDFQTLPAVLDKVNAMGLYSFSYKQDTAQSTQFGVIAQELETIFPEAVSLNADDEYNVAYAQLAVIALKALQEQQLELNALQAELTSLLQHPIK